jgi:hypothetical protein
LVDRPLDLRDEEPSGKGPGIPVRTAVVAAVILCVSGIFIGAVIPEIFNSEGSTENDPYSTPLSVLLSSTIDSLETDDKIYTDVTVPVAYYILLSEQSSNMSGTDSIVSDLLSFILGDDTPHKLTVATGQGWSGDSEHVITDNGRETTSPSSSTQSVVVDMNEGQEISIEFELNVWEAEIET